MDVSNTGNESKVETERTLPPASGSREEGRNLTANTTITTTTQEEKAPSTID
jgi:hypothetical protein